MGTVVRRNAPNGEVPRPLRSLCVFVEISPVLRTRNCDKMKTTDSELEGLRKVTMTEWEKLQAGLVYNDFDPDLFQRRVVAKKLFRQYNKTADDEIALRHDLMQKLFKHVGRDVWIEPDHALDAEERCQGACHGKPVHIGRRVWLGGDVKILEGVTIGDDTVIGAGSIVTKDIPSGVIAVGNPCRVVRQLTDADKTGYSKP